MTLSNQAHSPLFPPQKCESKVPGPCHFGTRIATSTGCQLHTCHMLLCSSRRKLAGAGARSLHKQAARTAKTHGRPQVSSSPPGFVIKSLRWVLGRGVVGGISPVPAVGFFNASDVLGVSRGG